MPNSTVPAADAGLPKINRRSALAKLGLGIAATSTLGPVVANAAPNKAAADPIFALIEEHRAAFGDAGRGYDRGVEIYEAAYEKEDKLLRRLLATKATTAAGVEAFSLYVSEYPDIENHSGDIGLLKAMTTIAAALGDIAVKNAA